ncbi:MAG: HNH endonuclease, partial [Thermoplasmata archaeon]|nr:HNH endonuclease [Thermoplasmata archaeon]
MDLIDSISNLQKNLDTLEKYRNSTEAVYREFYKDLIKRGRCFVVYVHDNNTHFAPSRFIGYKENDM